MSETKIVFRQAGVVSGLVGRLFAPPDGFVAEGSHDGEDWERLGERAILIIRAGELVRYVRFVEGP